MAKVRIKVKATPGKSRGGTLIARKVVALKKSAGPQGKAFFETRAQIAVHILNQNGEPRARSR